MFRKTLQKKYDKTQVHVRLLQQYCISSVLMLSVKNEGPVRTTNGNSVRGSGNGNKVA